MRRFLCSKPIAELPRISYDVVIVGAGLAGLYAALHINPSLKTLILNKRGPEESNSYYAQGGIAAVTKADDSFNLHIEDTLQAGAGLCNEDAVHVLVQEAPADIAHLLKLQVPFDRDEHGFLSITREGAHNKNRILHCGGDATGQHITQSLLKAVMQKPNIHMANQAVLVDIVTDKNGETAGLVFFDGQYQFCQTNHVILATGGIGRIYRNSTNSRSATGDGISAALRCGAALQDMEFVQFHPTALTHPDTAGRYFLISEALRGEGAVLRNRKWETFMKDAHPLADLAPRDIVSRAIVAQMAQYDIPNVYLDITTQSRDFLENRFPTIYQECMQRGIDIAKDWIPVFPVQHYFMGGIKTDLNGQTSIPGLYACGETACTGVHGANRLASNSLLECLVFGRRSAVAINEIYNGHVKNPVVSSVVSPNANVSDVASYRTEIRTLMTHKGGILRDAKGLSQAIAGVSKMLEDLESSRLFTMREVETYNFAIVALTVLNAALARTKSVGAHFRTDDKGGEKLC